MLSSLGADYGGTVGAGSSTDTAPRPWWCDAPPGTGWLADAWVLANTPTDQDASRSELCRVAGLVTRPPAAPVPPPYLSPEQTPAEVSDFWTRLQRQNLLEEAARQAEEQARQIAENIYRASGSPVEETETNWLLWVLLGIGGLVAMKAVVN